MSSLSFGCLLKISYGGIARGRINYARGKVARARSVAPAGDLPASMVA